VTGLRTEGTVRYNTTEYSDFNIGSQIVRNVKVREA